MAKDLNKVMVIGRLGKDPEMRFTPNGSAVTNFTVAAGRSWKTPDGEQKEETEWFSVVVWNKLAEICNQYLSKGSRIYIEGRLQTRSWDDTATGEKKYRTEVVAEDMIILDSRRDDEQPAAQPQRQSQNTPQQRPAAQARPAARQPRNDYSGPDVSDDEIPF